MDIEKARAERIAANRKELDRLGLGLGGVAAGPARRKSPASKKVNDEPVRRSTRNKGGALREPGLDTLSQLESKIEKKVVRRKASSQGKSPDDLSRFTENSTRIRRANVEALQRDWLGDLFRKPGKDEVVQTAAIDEGTGPARFSRMSGVTAWANAVFLWVNILEPGAPGACKYQNNIHGQSLTWWASQTCSPSSPLIERLVNSSTEGDSGTHVLLFCRLPSEPYVYCGTLRMDIYFEDEYPIRFVWRLKDYKALKDTKHFQRISSVCSAKEEMAVTRRRVVKREEP